MVASGRIGNRGDVHGVRGRTAGAGGVTGARARGGAILRRPSSLGRPAARRGPRPGALCLAAALLLALAGLAALPGELSAQSNIVDNAQPGVSGVEKVGETLKADRGSMANHDLNNVPDPNNARGARAWNKPSGIRWQRLDAGTWTDISDTNRRSYTLQTDDLGKQVRVHFWRDGYDYVGVAYPVGSTVRAATVPSLTGMALTSAAGDHTTGERIEFSVTFSGAVDVTGTPRMDIAIGSQIRHAAYASGSGSAALVFAYTVQARDDGSRIAIGQARSVSTNNKMTTIDLRGGSIRASGTTDAAILTNNHLTSGLGGYSGHRVNGGNAVRTTSLVSNIFRPNNADTVTLVIDTTTTGIAQSFRTDSNPGIFRDVQIQGILTASTQVAIYSDASGAPDTSLRSLTVANSGRLNGTILRYQSFGTSDPLSLVANTTYWVAVEGAGTLSTTGNTGEDTGGRMKGWSIGDRAYVKTSGTWGATTGTRKIANIDVRGVTDKRTTLVSSLREATVSSGVQFTVASGGAAQSFTTGAASTLTEVQIDGSFNSGSQVAIYSDNGGAPETSLATLQNPSTLHATFQIHEFRAAGNGLVLTAGTTYHVVVTGSGNLRHTSSDNEAGAAGWSLANAYLTPRTIGGVVSWFAAVSATALKIAVLGVAGGSSLAQVVDPPTVSGGPAVSAAGSDGAWAPDETVEVTLTFSEAVTVDTTDGTPSVGVSLGGTEARSAAYASGSGTAELVFGYTLVATDGSHTSMAVAPSSLALNGGTIRSQANGIDADLTHPGTLVNATRDGEADPPAGFTARFESLPERHDGETAFTFELHFSEAPVGLSYRTVQGALLDVSGANITHARRLTHGSNLGWEITAAPTHSGDIAIALPVRTCDAANAVCANGATLAQAVSATVYANPFSAAFENPPAEHDGTNPFEVRFHLTEEPAEVSYRTVRDSLFAVTGGSIANASRLEANKNRSWKLTVQPAGKADVTLTVKATTACDTLPGICTGDGRMLAGGLQVSIAGPAALTVADAEVDEAEGATLDFVVTLSKRRFSATTVDYATSDGTATAGSDYTATSGTLTFAALETTKTISVPVLDDAHDEGSETMTLTLSNASGAAIEDGEATGTITNTDAMPKAWIARFGRTVADQVLDAVESRLETPRAAGMEASLAGQPIGGAGPSDEALERREAESAMTALADWVRGETAEEEGAQGFGTRAVSERELLLGSSFALTGGSAGTGFGALWGRASVSGFDGRDGDLTVDGEVTSAMVGADWTRGPATAGLALAHSRGEGSYRSPGGDGVAESTLTGVYPYGRYALSERVSVWGVAGLGSGTLTLKPAIGTRIETDMALAMGALGLRGVLVEAPAEGGMELSVKTDAMAVRTTSDAARGEDGGNMAAAQADVTRLRLGLQATMHGMSTGSGGILTPSVEIGVRHDGGDAETGFGADIGAGLAWVDPASGLSADIRARGLLAHEADGFSERGFSGTLSWDPEPSTVLGPSLTLTQTVGAASSGGAEALLGRGTMEGLAPDDGGDALERRHLDARLGYGFALFGGRYTGTPQLGLGLSEAHRDYSLGWRLAEAQGAGLVFALDVEGARRESVAGDVGAEQRIGFDLGWRLRGVRREHVALEFGLEGSRIEAVNDNVEPEHRIGLRLEARW